MDEPSRVNGDQGGTDGHADDRRFVGSHRSIALDDLLQRPSADELHPEPDLIADLLRAEHRHDIRMADPREQRPSASTARATSLSGSGTGMSFNATSRASAASHAR